MQRGHMTNTIEDNLDTTFLLLCNILISVMFLCDSRVIFCQELLSCYPGITLIIMHRIKKIVLLSTKQSDYLSTL